MKITVLTGRYALSGVPLAQARFSRALAAAGHEVRFLIGAVNEGFDTPQVEGVRVEVLGQQRVSAMVPSLIRHFRAWAPEVVFSAGDHLNAVVLFAAIAGRSRAKISCSSRVTPFDTYSDVRFSKRWVLKQSMRALMPRADALTCVSADMVEQYRQVFPGARHTCVYNIVVDAAAQQRMREPLEEPWLAEKTGPALVAAGSLVTWKGFGELIDAMAEVTRHSPARLIILGEGPLRGELEAQVRRLGLEQHVKLPGNVANPLKYFARSDIFVLSSHVEGLPNVLVEAMMCGCTPVAANCPTGPREVLHDGEFGYLVPMKSPAALAEGILRAIERRTPAADLQRAIAPFEEQAVLDRHFELLGLGRARQRP